MSYGLSRLRSLLQTNNNPPEESDRLTAWTPQGAVSYENGVGPRSPQDRNRDRDYLANDELSDASRPIPPLAMMPSDRDTDRFRRVLNDYQLGRHGGGGSEYGINPLGTSPMDGDVRESLRRAVEGRGDRSGSSAWNDRTTNPNGSFNLLGRPERGGMDLGTGGSASDIDRAREFVSNFDRGRGGSGTMAEGAAAPAASSGLDRLRQLLSGGGPARSSNEGNMTVGRERLDYEGYQNRGLDKLADMNERELSRSMMMLGLQQLGAGLGGGSIASAGRWWN